MKETCCRCGLPIEGHDGGSVWHWKCPKTGGELDALGLRSQERATLRRLQITTIDELCGMTRSEFLRFRCVGPKITAAIEEGLARVGRSFWPEAKALVQSTPTGGFRSALDKDDATLNAIIKTVREE